MISLLVAALLQPFIGHTQRDTLVTDEGEWRLLQTSTVKDGARAKPADLKVRLYWGDQRMGVLQINSEPLDAMKNGKQIKTLYQDMRSWTWCALAFVDQPDPYLIVSGRWDSVATKPETTFLKMKGGSYVPMAQGEKTARLKTLESDCFALMKKSPDRFQCIEAHWTKGAWKLSKAPMVKANHYQDTSELVGIVSLWPRENLLVFENQIVQIDSDGIWAIEGWSKTHVVVRDVFGKVSTIDVRKIPRANGNLWKASASMADAADLLENGNKVTGPLFRGTEAAALDRLYEQGMGIGKLTSSNRFYTRSWDEKRNLTTVRQLVNGKGASPIVLTIRGYATPVYVKDRNHYIYIGETNSRFGPLVVYSNGRERELESNAQVFFPLRNQARSAR